MSRKHQSGTPKLSPQAAEALTVLIVTALFGARPVRTAATPQADDDESRFRRARNVTPESGVQS